MDSEANLSDLVGSDLFSDDLSAYKPNESTSESPKITSRTRLVVFLNASPLLEKLMSQGDDQ